ncbi:MULTISPECIES: hypothetical protein [unclassified Marinobacter]|uniref:hypothetical protein n=1 Tax=unclassified Marinobacter TaxID=83889 RepID=UPI000A917ABE|nr:MULTISPECIES: hypothetical protein [unclassified Marinobacter]
MSNTQPDSQRVIKNRKDHSTKKINELRHALGKTPEVTEYPNLTIIGAGSFSRLEASEFSDIDMFFFANPDKLEDPRTKELKLFGKLIQVISDLKFPKFSGDCEYLDILSIDKMFDILGSPTDDHQNYFTARMLLILESQWLYNEAEYEKLIERVIDYYFKDSELHKDDFRPIFLLNDICRYWKTILLNYEYRRKDDESKTKKKVHNYKLKYSRMMTCFATVCAIGAMPTSTNKEEVVKLIKMTPRERLEKVPKWLPNAQSMVNNLITKYSVFLDMTGLSKTELHQRFATENNGSKLLEEANEFGDAMFELIKFIDKEKNFELGLVRHLVI